VHWLYDPNLHSGSKDLTAEETKHARSLRLQPGEQIALTNGRGLVAVAVMTTEASYLVERLDSIPESRIRFHLVQALAKSDRDEMALQSVCELGITSVTPWAADRSIVKWDGKEEKNLERWRQIALAAMKQSQQAWLPELEAVSKTKNLEPRGLSLVLEPTAETALSDIKLDKDEVTLVVGPEGGISNTELAELSSKGFIPVRLGPSVLRTSTAGPAALAALQFASGYWR